jgi:hypothetical protein
VGRACDLQCQVLANGLDLRARLLQCPPLVFSLISVLARSLFGQAPVKRVGFCALPRETRRMLPFVGFLFCTTRELGA